MKISLLALSMLLGSFTAQAGTEVHATKLKCALLPSLQERIISVPTYPTYGLEFLGKINGVMAHFSIDEDHKLNIEISEYGKKIAASSGDANKAFSVKADTEEGQVEATCSPVQ